MKSIAAKSRAVNGPAVLRGGAPASLRARGGGGHGGGGGVHFGGSAVPCRATNTLVSLAAPRLLRPAPLHGERITRRSFKTS